MKFKFDKNLEYQQEAIKAIVDIFDTGKNVIKTREAFTLQSVSPIVANELEINEQRILDNVRNIQKQNKVEQTEKLNSMDFSVEMETGTGKTYVYLRTILEFYQKYGLKKFIVLVPSVAIREGVMKTIEQTTEHFWELYGVKLAGATFEYDSGKLSLVRSFVRDIDLKIMVMTIQSFNKDKNIMRQTPDRFGGDRPIDLVAQTQPIIIMDEPQNMESELSKASINDLKPLFKLRYSATHRKPYNLMYRLTPVDAYKQGLVKKIEVYGVREDDKGAFIFRVKEIIVKAGESPKARVGLEAKNAASAFVIQDIRLKAGDDLEQKTKNPKYQGIYVNEIDARRERVELSNGEFYSVEQVNEADREQIFRTQIHETIKAHFDKQAELGNNIKVLSLFFIDRVDNYIHKDSLIRNIFTEEFARLKKNYKHFKDAAVAAVHDGYFAKRREKGVEVYRDSVSGNSEDDKAVYDLIMKDKERLLSFAESISFIFSHSALREGWDNPNIFQICTLKETRTELKKRQEIGRGLRLAVNTEGDRIFDPRVNVLTVVANESYQDFVASLQAEYTEAGYREAPEAGNKRERVAIKFNKHLAAESSDFKNLWKQIQQKTRFNIELETQKIVSAAVKKINDLDINNLVIRVDKVMVDFDRGGIVKTIYEGASVGERLKRAIRIGNVIERIVRETGVTKKTIVGILSRVSNLPLIFKNPEEYMRSVSLIVRNTLNEIVINDGLKYIPSGDVWEVSLFENFDGYKSQTIKAEKSLYDRVIFDSLGEKAFAENLEGSPRILLYTKLPRNFVIDTPLGSYNPDWAIVAKTDAGNKVYLVRETKFGIESLEEDVRPGEQMKIVCGAKHFAAIGTNFAVATKSDLSDLLY